MSLIVVVHGIGQHNKGEELIADEWSPALRDGLRRAGGPGARALAKLTHDDLTVAFFGDIYRPEGRLLALADPWLTPDDAHAYDRELLAQWWAEAARVDPAVASPDDRSLARTSRTVQASLRALSSSKYFSKVADRAMLFDLTQVRRYFLDAEIRRRARQRVEAVVNKRTAVILAHSLGSVVAYEALCHNPEWQVRSLITLGSPLGIRNLIFDRLDPLPDYDQRDGPRGRWPGAIRWWSNIADQGDIVALAKDLRPLFGQEVRNFVVHNGSEAHDVSPYLTAKTTGELIAEAISRSAGE